MATRARADMRDFIADVVKSLKDPGAQTIEKLHKVMERALYKLKDVKFSEAVLADVDNVNKQWMAASMLLVDAQATIGKYARDLQEHERRLSDLREKLGVPADASADDVVRAAGESAAKLGTAQDLVLKSQESIVQLARALARAASRLGTPGSENQDPTYASLKPEFDDATGSPTAGSLKRAAEFAGVSDASWIADAAARVPDPYARRAPQAEAEADLDEEDDFALEADSGAE